MASEQVAIGMARKRSDLIGLGSLGLDYGSGSSQGDRHLLLSLGRHSTTRAAHQIGERVLQLDGTPLLRQVAGFHTRIDHHPHSLSLDHCRIHLVAVEEVGGRNNQLLPGANRRLVALYTS